MNYDLLSGYTEMAAGLSREYEAVEWCEALVVDHALTPVMILGGSVIREMSLVGTARCS